MLDFNQTGIWKSAEEISKLIQNAIMQWHIDALSRDDDYVIVTDQIRKIRVLNEHREELMPVILELVNTNTEMWHEEDKVRSQKDEVVLKAIRNINPLNQHRNDLIEEIDEIFVEKYNKVRE